MLKKIRIIISYILFFSFFSCKKVDTILDRIVNNPNKKIEYILSGEKYTYTQAYSFGSEQTLEYTYNYNKNYNLESRYSYAIFNKPPFQRFDTTYYFLVNKEYFRKLGVNGESISLGTINAFGYLSKEGSKVLTDENTIVERKISSSQVFYDTTFKNTTNIFDNYGHLLKTNYNSLISKISVSSPWSRQRILSGYERLNTWNDLGLMYTRLIQNINDVTYAIDNNGSWKILTTSTWPLYDFCANKLIGNLVAPVSDKTEIYYIKSKFDLPVPNVTEFKSDIIKIDSITKQIRSYSFDGFKSSKIYLDCQSYIQNIETEIDGRVLSYDVIDFKGDKLYTREFIYKIKE